MQMFWHVLNPESFHLWSINFLGGIIC